MAGVIFAALYFTICRDTLLQPKFQTEMHAAQPNSMLVLDNRRACDYTFVLGSCRQAVNPSAVNGKKKQPCLVS
jgi:hypothetical protein